MPEIPPQEKQSQEKYRSNSLSAQACKNIEWLRERRETSMERFAMLLAYPENEITAPLMISHSARLGLSCTIRRSLKAISAVLAGPQNLAAFEKPSDEFQAIVIQHDAEVRAKSMRATPPRAGLVAKRSIRKEISLLFFAVAVLCLIIGFVAGAAIEPFRAVSADTEMGKAHDAAVATPVIPIAYPKDSLPEQETPTAIAPEIVHITPTLERTTK